MNKQIDLEFYRKLIDQIAVSEKFKNNLKSAVEEAFRNPRSFYDETGEYILAWRGLTFAGRQPLTAKFVLIDKMIEIGQMAEIDWKEEEKEIRFLINKILKGKNYDLKLSDEIQFEDEDTFKILNSINQTELKPNGFCLELLDIDSDSYVFTITPINEQKQTAEMFAALK